ncbi:MAG TPA: MerR family transcriptional regulator [Cyanobacteria bacterium UBA11149]|nr:MerR family transcriptional regulator [Cyanobacteria bacterium UBA11367]HBE56280.1 MerR family transcriptional regulator [Cyanobacteria bacterium UBA11366]HBK65060.1 MerR family transcriptional regulator [Cyanobacteria bacterium UBA11166]HBR75989.1 MerR family transcriptional regulator [Cyanobacteria bacterium UBA11159]HBS72614.1 MerR family transcriptional regulator [Cyanobacteria bacterium UBA11153]HBW88697.1 MerR family transcriptional regulator [Cyanobacteria bacterium UBA11149]HCA9677
MNILQQLALSNPSWSLEAFVQITNDLLPQYLPTQPGNTRIREEVTPRLVRHYTTLEMVDEPFKEGRYAIYNYRHLLQILVVRRLLSEGFGASAIAQLARKKTNIELENLLSGGVELSVTPANPALAYLEQLQQERYSTPSSLNLTTHTPEIVPSKINANQWIRLEILPGLELHIREDFPYPNSPNEYNSLLQSIAQKLKDFTANRKR